ncbi:MAG: hypothetical protein LBK95_14800 [Bifidobacteriaceae bacterium]|jgi:hypothetical protein|nr:hypothetical protein [Bifidobacteriaceae bacterium]
MKMIAASITVAGAWTETRNNVYEFEALDSQGKTQLRDPSAGLHIRADRAASPMTEIW